MPHEEHERCSVTQLAGRHVQHDPPVRLQQMVTAQRSVLVGRVEVVLDAVDLQDRFQLRPDEVAVERHRRDPDGNVVPESGYAGLSQQATGPGFGMGMRTVARILQRDAQQLAAPLRPATQFGLELVERAQPALERGCDNGHRVGLPAQIVDVIAHRSCGGCDNHSALTDRYRRDRRRSDDDRAEAARTAVDREQHSDDLRILAQHAV